MTGTPRSRRSELPLELQGCSITTKNRQVVLRLKLFGFDSNISPVDRPALALESDVAGFCKGVLRDVRNQCSIQVAPNFPVLGNDLYGIPLPNRLSGADTCWVIRDYSGLGSAHRYRHFEVVFSLNLERSPPDTGLCDKKQVTRIGV